MGLTEGQDGSKITCPLTKPEMVTGSSESSITSFLTGFFSSTVVLYNISGLRG